MGSAAPHNTSPGDYPGTAPQVVEKKHFAQRGVSYTGEQLRRWKSLEGDWRTFRYPGYKQEGRGYATERRDLKSVSEIPMHISRYERTVNIESAICRESIGFKDTENEEDGWCDSSLAFQYEKERSCSSDLSKHSDVVLDSQEFHMTDRLGRLYEELRARVDQPHRVFFCEKCFTKFVMSLPRDEALSRVVHSSYPLLKENWSLLQKLKKERDVCRQLENDMRDLEGQIQDVSKSFTTTTGLDVDSRHGSCANSEGGYMSDESPVLNGSYEEVFTVEESQICQPVSFTQELDPVAVIEDTLAGLMDLAERLEVAVRERDVEVSQLMEASSLHPITTEWVRPSFQLSRIPSELVDLLQDLQAALRLLLSSRDWECSRQHGDQDCSSPASFTFHSFGRGRVLVPTVRTIFSPVGDSVEMRPVQEQSGELYHSTTSLEQFSEVVEESVAQSTPPYQEQDNSVQDDFQEISQEMTSEELCTHEDLSRSKEQPNASEFPAPLDHQPSAEIIKRIERLQELVKPELCESLKQRALRIQKAKEDFLSGVVRDTVEDHSNQESEVGQTDILIEDVTVPAPNGLTVKEQAEDKKSMLSLLRKKKRQSWCSEDLCTESLALEDKSDWLRNPFRPKGKYKINK